MGWVPQKSAILMQRPQHKSTPVPVAASKSIPFGTIFIEFGDTKTCCTFSGLELVPKSRNKLICDLAACTKVQNAFKPFGTIRKKFLLSKRTKKARCVRYLGKKPHFGAFPETQKCVLKCARLRKAAQRPNNNANPSEVSEKKVYCVESL